MADPVLQTTIEVTVNGGTYEFAIPTLHLDAKVGHVERKLRRAADPDGNGEADGLDWGTRNIENACAVFEVLLRKASVTWPFSTGPNGAPVVDSSKFPLDKNDEVVAVWIAFQNALTQFRQGRASAAQSGGGQALEGQPDPGAQPV